MAAPAINDLVGRAPHLTSLDVSYLDVEDRFVGVGEEGRGGEGREGKGREGKGRGGKGREGGGFLFCIYFID